MRNKSGFTIVELLIVIVIVAILAAISVVAYNGIQNRAYDTTVKNDLASIAKKIQMFNADKGAYPSDIANDIASNALYSVKVSQSAYMTNPGTTYNLMYCSASPYTSYALLAISKSGARLYASNSAGVREYTGGVSWTGTGIPAMCESVLPGTTNLGSVGYHSTAPPLWRPWTGVN